MDKPNYRATHWTHAAASGDVQKNSGSITVNDRAATRQAIISMLQNQGLKFVDRSQWHAQAPEHTENDWDYSKIAIHHAGRSYRCGCGMDQMIGVQAKHRGSKNFDDIGYHYAVDCSGDIYEGSDIRFKGSHILHQNTGKIGIVLLENLSEPEEESDQVAAGLKIVKALGLLETPSIPNLQRSSVQILIKTLRKVFDISRLGGHSEFAASDDMAGRNCPGVHGMDFVTDLRSLFRLSPP